MERKAKDAIHDLENAIAEEPKFPLAHYFLGVAYRATGSPKMAKEEFTTALQLMPGLYKARLALAEIHMGFGDIQLAQEEVDKYGFQIIQFEPKE